MKGKGKEKCSGSSAKIDPSFTSVALVFEDESEEEMSIQRKKKTTETQKTTSSNIVETGIQLKVTQRKQTIHSTLKTKPLWTEIVETKTQAREP